MGGGRLEPCTLLGATENYVLATDSKEFPQKFRITTWPSNSTSGYILEIRESRDLKRYLHPHVHSSTIHRSQEVETTQAFISGWVHKENTVDTYTICNFMCPLDWAMGCPESWSNVILDVSLRMFSAEGILKLKAWMEQKRLISPKWEGIPPAWWPWAGTSVFPCLQPQLKRQRLGLQLLSLQTNLSHQGFWIPSLPAVGHVTSQPL